MMIHIDTAVEHLEIVLQISGSVGGYRDRLWEDRAAAETQRNIVRRGAWREHYNSRGYYGAAVT